MLAKTTREHIDNLTDQDRAFISNQLDDLIKFLTEALQKEHSEIKSEDVETLLRHYLN